MLHERYIDTWLLNANLKAGLRLWQENPDSPEVVKKIKTSLRWGAKQEGLKILVKSEAVGKLTEDGVTITNTSARNHGAIEKNKVVFETSRELVPRIDFIKGKAYMMFDSAKEPTFAFLRPGDIESIVSK